MKLVACTFLLILSTAFGLPEPLKPIDWDRVRPIHQLESWRKLHPVLAEHYPISSGSNQINGRIINGQIAEPNSFPYQIVLLATLPDVTDYYGFCGGSIITPNNVMTAAHCVDIATKIDIFTGAHNIGVAEPLRQVHEVPASDIKVHPDWNAAQIRNDIAIAKLPTSLIWSSHVQKVALPPPPSFPYETYAGKQAVASGWGRYNDSSQDISDELRWVNLNIITNLVCIASFVPDIIVIPSTNMCTSRLQQRSTCNGDSGGPLVYDNSGTPTQVGIVSFGSARGCTAGPSVFTRVTSFVNWIVANID